MKKLYSIVASVALFATTASAATPIQGKLLDAPAGLKAAKVECKAAQPDLKLAKTTDLLTLKEAAANGIEVSGMATTKVKVKAKEAEEREWKSLGKGQWREDLLTFSPIVSSWLAQTGNMWPVEVEESDGWYRCQPYADPTNPIAELLGETDETYFYIDATDPSHVYADIFYPYELCYFINCVPEYISGNDTNAYGTLVDGLIEWAPISEESITWTYTTNFTKLNFWDQTTGVGLALPGHYLPNFSFSASYDVITSDGTATVELATGYSYEEIAFAALKGLYDISDPELQDLIVEYGTKIPNGNHPIIEFGLNHGNGLYSLMFVGMDKDGNIQGTANAYIVNHSTEGEDWKLTGSTEFTDEVYSAAFTNIDPTTYSVEIEADQNHPGNIRLVNAFTCNPDFLAFADVNDATDNNLYFQILDKDHVLLNASSTGLNLGLGYGLVWSMASFLLEDLSGEEYENAYAYCENKGYFGYIDEEGYLHIPAGSLSLSMQDFRSADFLMFEDSQIAFQLPEEVLGVESAVIAGQDAPAVYYNLQGVRVANPAKGGIYIRTQNGEASKVAF